jgi:hypothetical protein
LWWQHCFGVDGRRDGRRVNGCCSGRNGFSLDGDGGGAKHQRDFWLLELGICQHFGRRLGHRQLNGSFFSRHDQRKQLDRRRQLDRKYGDLHYDWSQRNRE